MVSQVSYHISGMSRGQGTRHILRIWRNSLMKPAGYRLDGHERGALCRRHSFVMRIYADCVSVEEGFLAKESSEFFIKDIRSIDARQGVWGRLVGIGDVTISTAATIDAAEEARGVPRSNRIKDLLIAQRQQSTIWLSPQASSSPCVPPTATPPCRGWIQEISRGVNTP